MERIPPGPYAEVIAEALGRLPATLRRRLASVRFVCGVDPAWVGLHDWQPADPGRPYASTAHCCWSFHLKRGPVAEQRPTVVLPQPCEPWIVVHELGHALDEFIDWHHHEPEPVSLYAQTDRWEAFAEAFACWLCPIEYASARNYLLADRQTVTFFESLAALAA